MRGNEVVDYSESDLMYLVILEKLGNHWKVTSLTTALDPNGTHP